MTKKTGEDAPKGGIAIEAGVLAAAMKHAAAVVEARNTIPILANVRLFADGDMLELAATDLDVEIRQRVPLLEPGVIATTVDAKRLFALSSAVAAKAQITLAPDDKRLAVKSGRSRWLLPCLPLDDFPSIVFEPTDHEIEIGGAVLASAVARCAPFVCTELTRYYLCGTFLNQEDGHLRLASTNGNCMAVLDLPDIAWPEGAPEPTIPPKFLRAAIAAMGDAAMPCLRWGASKLQLCAGDVTVTGKAIDCTYPDYRRVQPSPQDKPALFDPVSMRDALRRVKLISNEKNRSVKMVFGDGKITLSVSCPDTGMACEEIPADCAAGHETGFNAAYLDDMLAALGGDTVEFHHADAGAPMLLRRKVADGMAGTIMPMRV